MIALTDTVNIKITSLHGKLQRFELFKESPIPEGIQIDVKPWLGNKLTYESLLRELTAHPNYIWHIETKSQQAAKAGKYRRKEDGVWSEWVNLNIKLMCPSVLNRAVLQSMQELEFYFETPFKEVELVFWMYAPLSLSPNLKKPNIAPLHRTG